MRIPVRWRWCLHGVSLTLLVTGLAWLALDYSVGTHAGELPHPAQAWCMRLHGLASFAALMGLGAVAAAHVPKGWRVTHAARHVHAAPMQRQRWSGIALCTATLLLVASAYALYYFAPENLRPGLGWAHTIVGMAMAALLGWHGCRTRSHQRT